MQVRMRALVIMREIFAEGVLPKCVPNRDEDQRREKARNSEIKSGSEQLAYKSAHGASLEGAGKAKGSTGAGKVSNFRKPPGAPRIFTRD